MSVMVIAEHREGQLRDATLETLEAARGLGAGRVCALLLTDTGEGLIEQLTPYCDTLYLARNPGFLPPLAQAWLPFLKKTLAETAPVVAMAPATSWGMELFPRLAEEMDAPFAPDVTKLAYEDGELSGERMVYSGKLIASWRLPAAPMALATIRPGSYPKAVAGEKASIETLDDSSPEESAVRFVRYLRQAAGDVDICAARILVSVGRGIGGPENIHLAEELAQALGGVVSCSRPVADKQWLGKSRQVGTSGQTVRPRIYLALGISGAFQHLAGMQGSETIIAVNKDPKAPIFRAAHYGVVGDIFEVLPLITEKVRKLGWT